MRRVFFQFFLLLSFGALPAYAKTLEFQGHQKITEYKPDKIGKDAKVSVHTQEMDFSVVVGADKVLIKNDQQDILYELDKDIFTVFDHQKKQSVEVSLYALPAFAAMEKRNRVLFINKVLSLAKAPPVSPFELDMLFGGSYAPDSVTKLKAEEEGGQKTYTYDGDVVAKFSFGDQQLDSEQATGYKKYLVISQQIHPLIRDDIAGIGRPLSVLEYRNKSHVPEKIEKSFSFSGFNSGEAVSYQSPEGYEKRFALDDKIDHVIRLSQTIKEKSTNDYLDEMTRLFEEHKSLEAALSFYEYSVHYGGQDVEKLKGIITRIFKESPPESGVLELARVIDTKPSNKEKLSEAITFLEGLKAEHSGAASVYILDVFLSNFYAFQGDVLKARVLLLGALEKNPHMSGAYKDLGDKYIISFDTWNAWACWDHMRHLHPNHLLIKPVNDFEKKLKADYSEYFK